MFRLKQFSTVLLVLALHFQLSANLRQPSRALEENTNCTTCTDEEPFYETDWGITAMVLGALGIVACMAGATAKFTKVCLCDWAGTFGKRSMAVGGVFLFIAVFTFGIGTQNQK